MSRRVAPIAQLVCPHKDSPLFWLHRVGWLRMDKFIWPENGPLNAVLFYLLGRRRSTYIDDAIGLIAWLLLLAAEVTATILHGYARSTTAWRILLPLELLLAPLVFGIWAQLMVFLHYKRFRSRIPIEEAMITRMTPREVVCGFALRPVMLQMGANLLFTGISVVCLAFAFFHAMGTSSLIPRFDYVLIGGLLVYRYFILKSCIEYASVHAIRSCLFIEDPVKLASRMMRDWMVPWGLIPVIFAALVAVVVYLCAMLPGLMCFLLPVVVLLTVWFIWSMPSLIRSFAQEAFYAMELNSREWVIRTGEEYRGVPQGILKGWKLETRYHANGK
ncbi:hypothetical protein IT570_11905 [Candidatus Sumerlaeota bacterium]|nr:hypothetical protein [Candidatus Sumerlaeota bacterium]